MGKAKRALGTKLKKGTTYIGGLTDINGIDKSADTIDVTTLDSEGGYREFIASFKDGGEVTISGYFLPGNAGQVEMETAFESGIEDSFEIEFPAGFGASWIFKGVVTQVATGASLEDPVSFEATIKVSGKPNLGTTPSAGVSALVLSGGGTLAPSFDNEKFGYSYTFETDTSITVTATAADHKIKLYIDNVFVQDLTTAVASNAIAGFAVGTAKKIDIIAFENGKTSTTYTVIAVKTA